MRSTPKYLGACLIQFGSSCLKPRVEFLELASTRCLVVEEPGQVMSLIVSEPVEMQPIAFLEYFCARMPHSISLKVH